MAERSDPVRADAQRNRQLVLDAGLELLSRDPTMSMQEVADASGLGRTTVYRHFSNRDELLEAVFDEAATDSRRTMAGVLSDESGVEETVRSVSSAIFGLNLRYGPLLSLREMGSEPLEAAKEDGKSPLRGYIKAARKRGEIHSDMPVHWQLAVMQTLSLEALDEANHGDLDEAEAERLVADSLVSILIPR